MFEKHRDGNQDPASRHVPQDSFTAPAGTPAHRGKVAIIGPGIHVHGDINGDEDLVIEGKVDGKIRLKANQVDIGHSGKVQADITAKVIKIAGDVKGDITGMEKVIISRTGNVNGNIIAPRMTLEDGAIFKGSIDMNPGEPAKTEPARPAKPAIGKAGEPSKIIANEKTKEGSGRNLNGG